MEHFIPKEGITERDINAVEEESGLLEVPATGFRIKVRGGSVRLIGFISRHLASGRVVESTLVVHFPLWGFIKSWKCAAKAMENVAVLTMMH